jgi:hypothetical protein
MSLYPLLVAAVNAGDPPATPPTYVELLPATASSKHSGIRWTPSADEFGPTAGTLEITCGRTTRRVEVVEFACDWAGRAWTLVKLDPGSDPSESSYHVFCGRDGSRQCSCKGFTRFGHCCHVAALEALLENRWI